MLFKVEERMADIVDNLAAEMIPAVEEEMQGVLSLEGGSSDPFLGMLHYHMGWRDAFFRERNISGGKRIRPLLCMLSCMAAGGDWHQAIPAAASLELLHNFSLIHDDIQDMSPTRRGRETVWKIWGVNQAINAGDALFAFAHLAMARLETKDVPVKSALKALRMLDETCLALTRGQHTDMNFENRQNVSVDEYMSMINGKTAALLSLSTELGAIIAGCGEEIVEHYGAFGRDLGLAFQIRDDILGIWGDESIIGKSAATDIATRKKSLPVLYALSRSSDLRELYAEHAEVEDFVSQVVTLLNLNGARDFAEQYEKTLAGSALGHLEAVSPEGRGGQALLQITHKLLNRQF